MIKKLFALCMVLALVSPVLAATIAVNYTFTGAAGTSAIVTNIGSSNAASLDFTIPQGAKGDKGDTGDPGTCDLSDVYPVGSIYISVTSTNPNTLFGFGTWAAFGTGRMPIGIDAGNTQFDVVKETGGSNVSSAVVSHTHPVTITDPSHAHVQNKNTGTTGALSGYGIDASTSTSGASGYSTENTTTGITASTSNPAGSVSSFSIMNPYIVVYMWERTA